MLKKKIAILTFGMMASTMALAGDPPSIGGQAAISADIQGGIINGGAAADGAIVTLKQSVASVLHGSIGGALKLSVSLKGGIINAGAADAAAEVSACQSIGSIGSDC
jgi:hypothetical protein